MSDEQILQNRVEQALLHGPNWSEPHDNSWQEWAYRVGQCMTDSELRAVVEHGMYPHWWSEYIPQNYRAREELRDVAVNVRRCASRGAHQYDCISWKAACAE